MSFYNIFINSKNRSKTEPVYNFEVSTVGNNIKFEKDDIVYLSVVEFSMINSIYNISPIYGNNTFVVRKTDIYGNFPTDTQYTIPSGNYDVNTLCDILNGLLSGFIQVSYNKYQNTYTFTNINPVSRYYIIPNGCVKILGISVMTEILQTSTTGSYINMVNFSKVILKISNINVNYFCYDNLSTTDNILDTTNTIFWIDKNDILPFQNISYVKNGDNIFTYQITNTVIDSFKLSLSNEYNQPLTDAEDFFLVLQIQVEKSNDMFINKQLGKIATVLTEIYELFLMSLNHFGFFKSLKKI